MDFFVWLKSILEKFDKYSILWGCLGCAAFAIIFPHKSKWWLVLVFCAICLLVDGIRRLWKYILKQIDENNEIKKRRAEKEEQIENENAEIWHMFIGLGQDPMKYLVKIFNEGEKDYENIYVRIIENGESIMEWRLGRFPLGIHFESLPDSITLNFDPYFYKLIEHYIKTGKKEQVD
jgi:hypothetical protein